MTWSVYRNLRLLPRVGWSLRRNGRVQRYASSVLLKGVTMKHATAAQLERVQTGHREVCQWLNCGSLESVEEGDVLTESGHFWLRLYCDPKVGVFTNERGDRVDAARAVLLLSDGSAHYRT